MFRCLDVLLLDIPNNPYFIYLTTLDPTALLVPNNMVKASGLEVLLQTEGTEKVLAHALALFQYTYCHLAFTNHTREFF